MAGRWDILKESVKESEEECIEYTKQKAKKPWVPTEMIEKMDERRKWKNINTEEGRRIYRRLNKQLRREADGAREKWLEGQCIEMEELGRIGGYDLLYQKGEQICEKQRTSWNVQEIEGRNGQRLTRPENIRSKNGKPPEQDEIAAEFFKNLDGGARKELKEINKEVYIEGDCPSDFVNIIMITLRKKRRPTKCSEYRTISLIS